MRDASDKFMAAANRRRKPVGRFRPSGDAKPYEDESKKLSDKASRRSAFIDKVAKLKEETLEEKSIAFKKLRKKLSSKKKLKLSKENKWQNKVVHHHDGHGDNMHEAKKPGFKDQVIGVDSWGKSDGHHIARRAFYYRHGGDSAAFAKTVSSQLDKAGVKHVVVDHGEKNARFRGGASVANSSHWWAKIKMLHEGVVSEAKKSHSMNGGYGTDPKGTGELESKPGSQGGGERSRTSMRMSRETRPGSNPTPPPAQPKTAAQIGNKTQALISKSHSSPKSRPPLPVAGRGLASGKDIADTTTRGKFRGSDTPDHAAQKASLATGNNPGWAAKRYGSAGATMVSKANAAEAPQAPKAAPKNGNNVPGKAQPVATAGVQGSINQAPQKHVAAAKTQPPLPKPKPLAPAPKKTASAPMKNAQKPMRPTPGRAAAAPQQQQQQRKLGPVAQGVSRAGPGSSGAWGVAQDKRSGRSGGSSEAAANHVANVARARPIPVGAHPQMPSKTPTSSVGAGGAGGFKPSSGGAGQKPKSLMNAFAPVIQRFQTMLKDVS